MKKKYDYPTWKSLFSEIQYAHEAQYPPSHGNTPYETGSSEEYVSFYKLTIWQRGELEYKGQWSTYDPRLWPKVKLLYKLFEEDGIVDILYGSKT